MLADILNTILISFIPLFVAIDAVGGLPLFISIAEGLSTKERRKILNEATLVALAVAILFLLAGRAAFSFLGISEDDFRVAGGLVLLIFAVSDLLFPSTEKKSPEASIGIVPLGIPLIMGPAALTTILIVADAYGKLFALISIVLNLLFVWVTFRYSDRFLKIIGTGGSRAVARIASLFMAAIAVMMIRVGLTGMINAIGGS